MGKAYAICAALLKPGEKRVPREVLQVARWFVRNDIWFKLSRNRSAGSCADAAKKRQLLGHEGIALWQELKTYYGKVKVSGEFRYFAAHYRGDRMIDLAAVREALRLPSNPKRCTVEELSTLGLAYGQLNPFLLRDTGIVQIFDPEVFEDIGVPHTMMTNAGHHEWAIEFYPAHLTRSAIDFPFEIAQIVSRVKPSRIGPGVGPYSIAILTGNAPESGSLLYDKLFRCVRVALDRHCRGDRSLPHILLESSPRLGLTMELRAREAQVKVEIERLVRDICQHRRPNVLAVACNTTHYFSDMIRGVCAEYGVEFVSMPEVVAAHLRATGTDVVGLIGIPAVSDFALGLSAYESAFRGIRLALIPEPVRQRITQIAYDVKQNGAERPAYTRLRDCIRNIRGAEHVVLALTELSLLIDRCETAREAKRSNRELIDPLELLAEALAKKYVGPR